MKNIGRLLFVLGGGFIVGLIVIQLFTLGIYTLFGCSGDFPSDAVTCPGSVGKNVEVFIELLGGGSFLLSFVGGPIALLVVMVGLLIQSFSRLKRNVPTSGAGIPITVKEKPKLSFYFFFKLVIVGIVGSYLFLLILSLI